MIDEEQYKVLSQQLQRFQRKKDEATGALKQLQEILRKDFDCSTVEQGQKLLKRLQREQASLELEAEKEYVKFQQKYGKRLESLDGKG
jgi:hypothetical protein